MNVFSHLNRLSLLVYIKGVVYKSHSMFNSNQFKTYENKKRWREIAYLFNKILHIDKWISDFIYKISLCLTKNLNWITEVVTVLMYVHNSP